MPDHQQPFRKLRVFLCHSSDDKPAVRTLYHQLRADGIEPWLDEEDLLPGQDWEAEIRKAVRASDVVIVCLSRNSSAKTGFVQKEMRYALDIAQQQPEDRIFIIPARLEECTVPDRLSHLHWVNLYNESGYPLLLRTLQKVAEQLQAKGVQHDTINAEHLSPPQEGLSDQLAQLAARKELSPRNLGDSDTSIATDLQHPATDAREIQEGQRTSGQAARLTEPRVTTRGMSRMTRPNTSWRSWGDHPIIITILVSTALIGAVVAALPLVWGDRQVVYSGRVRDASIQAPIGAAKVTLDFGSVPQIVYTDTEGVFRFSLTLGGEPLNGRVRVDASGYTGYDRNITISRNARQLEDIRLAPAVAVAPTLTPAVTTPTSTPSSPSVSTATPTTTLSDILFDFETNIQGWDTDEGGLKTASLSVTTDHKHTGRQSLMLTTELLGGQSEDPRSSDDIYRHTVVKVYFSSARRDGLNIPETYDITGRQVSCYIFLPRDFANQENLPIVRIMVKDKLNRNNSGQELFIDENQTERWIHLSMQVGSGDHPDDNFDQTEVIALGIVIVLPNESSQIYDGSIYIDDCAIN